MDPLPANIYNEIFNVTNMDVDGRMKIFDLIRQELVTVIHEYVRFTHGIPAFQNLPSKDQASLLKGTIKFFNFVFQGVPTFEPRKIKFIRADRWMCVIQTILRTLSYLILFVIIKFF